MNILTDPDGSVGRATEAIETRRTEQEDRRLTMAQAKRNSKRKRRNIALPGVGVAGMSLALTGGASGATAPVMDQPSRAYLPSHQITLGEEEMSDVSLATFYVFDQENLKSIKGELQLAR